MFESLEENLERFEGRPSVRERWFRYVAVFELATAGFGGLYAAIKFLG